MASPELASRLDDVLEAIAVIGAPPLARAWQSEPVADAGISAPCIKGPEQLIS
jgi:hypothetical protein